jgi:GT2 family glycosyltransferase
MEPNKIFISVIIPTYRRSRQLQKCLTALIRQDYPKNRFEVIVVNDDYETPIDNILSQFQDKLQLYLLNQSHLGPGSGRNLGVQKAKGQYLAFTDDDCAPASDWLNKLTSVITDKPECAVGGKIINALSENPYATASQMIIDYVYSYYNVNHVQSLFFTTSNLTVPAKLFHEIGGFDSKNFPFASEDRDLCDRWLEKGNKMIYQPDALVYHFHKYNFFTFCRQHFLYGQGNFQLYQQRALRNSKKAKLESQSFYIKMATYPFTQNKNLKALMTVLLICCSQIFSLTGYIRRLLQ